VLDKCLFVFVQIRFTHSAAVVNGRNFSAISTMLFFPSTSNCDIRRPSPIQYEISRPHDIAERDGLRLDNSHAQNTGRAERMRIVAADESRATPNLAS